jgi:hypothetical protein
MRILHSKVEQNAAQAATMADPKIPRTVAGDGQHKPAGHGGYGNGPAVLEVGNPTVRGDPNSTAIVRLAGIRY